MEETYHLLATIGFPLLSLTCIVIFLAGVSAALKRGGKDAGYRMRVMRNLMILIGVWVVAFSVMSLSGFLGDFDAMPPRPAFILPPFLIVTLYLIFSGKADEILKHTPPQWLLAVQVFRIPVEFCIWFLFMSNELPEMMTFEGRNFDIIAGITGPIFAVICFGNGRFLRGLAIAWNFISLGLLINIVTIAILTFPTPFQVFTGEPGNTIVMEMPYVTLPTILVVMAYSCHFLSIRQLTKGLYQGPGTKD